MDVEELRDTIVEKTNLTVEQAKEAAAAVVTWMQDNMPDDASDQVREFTATASEWAAQTLSSVGEAAADMLDQMKSGEDNDSSGTDADN